MGFLKDRLEDESDEPKPVEETLSNLIRHVAGCSERIQMITPGARSALDVLAQLLETYTLETLEAALESKDRPSSFEE